VEHGGLPLSAVMILPTMLAIAAWFVPLLETLVTCMAWTDWFYFSCFGENQPEVLN
jgi:hypothetical protein